METMKKIIQLNAALEQAKNLAEELKGDGINIIGMEIFGLNADIEVHLMDGLEKLTEAPRKEFVEGEKISYYRNNFDLGNVEYFSISEVKDNASVAV